MDQESDAYSTRMHSRRMRTARGSSRPRGGLPEFMLGYTTPPGVGLETPWVWAWRHPPPDPSASPLGVGLEIPLGTCKACWDTTCNVCWDTTLLLVK